MKRHHKFGLLAIAILFGSMAFAQSLGDAARAAQTHKNKSPNAKVYTNDDIEGNSQITQPTTEPSKAPDSAAAPAAKSQAGTATETKPPATPDSKPPVAKAEDWKGKLDGQKKVVADMSRELNLMEREHQVRVATYYADAGNQLRDSKKWFEDEKKYEEDHAARQKDLANAKQKLEDMKDDARKAGAPASVLD